MQASAGKAGVHRMGAIHRGKPKPLRPLKVVEKVVTDPSRDALLTEFGKTTLIEKLIPLFLINALNGQPLPIYGDGRNVRDWIYVLDHCRALELCLLKGAPGETYNIGADNEINNLEITRLILKYFKHDSSWVEFVSDRPGHDRRYAIDASKIRKELGWKPRYKFKKAFRETINWYMANKKWVDRIRKKTKVFNPHIDLWKAHKASSLKN